MSKDYEQNNDELLETLLDKLFYKAMRVKLDRDEDHYSRNFNKLELIFNYACNLGCKYCYGFRHGEELYPSSISNKEKITENVGLVIEFLKENKLYPEIEIFSGEPLVQDFIVDSIYDIIDGLADYYKEDGRTLKIVIPTNFTFMLTPEGEKKIRDLLNYSDYKEIHMGLSASVEGKYMEQNRPFRTDIESVKCSNRNYIVESDSSEDPRDDEYYDRVFKFAKEFNLGFHPMIYSNDISLWKKNFNWFHKMMKKHNIPWNRLYLLEVRNMEWTMENCKDLEDLIRHIISFLWRLSDKNPDLFMKYIFELKGHNIISSPLTTVGRGLGCGLQSGIYIRLGDLSLVTCHRTSYEFLTIGKYTVEDGRITGIKADNVSFWISELGFDSDTMPFCERCVIRDLCSKTCLGANYEDTGEPFVSSPSVCRLEHHKIKGLIKGFSEIGMLQRILERLSDKKRINMLNFIEIMESMKNE